MTCYAISSLILKVYKDYKTGNDHITGMYNEHLVKKKPYQNAKTIGQKVKHLKIVSQHSKWTK